MEEAIVLYPSPGMGHLISMVEFGKLLLKHYPSFSIKILLFTAPYSTGSTSDYIATVSATVPSISFHHLPTISLPPATLANNILDLAYEIPHLNNPNLLNALQTLSQSCHLNAFLLDFFNDSAFQVTDLLNIPTYYFYTSSASTLALLFLYFPTLHHGTTASFEELGDAPLEIPGLPRIPASSMPKHLSPRDTKMYKRFLETAYQMRKSKGIIVNTFELLEPRAVTSISQGLYVPDAPTPPIYCLGPLIANSGAQQEKCYSTCLGWLSEQPSKSVVFLCFGSMGRFSAKQLMEMAIGLEKSGHRFLWVVRDPTPEEDNQSALSVDIDEKEWINGLMPRGFVERTKERGLIVKSWAPQVAILNHDSVGGFVTHCGWNSSLEAICAGVPMLAWPLYAEQSTNKVFLVEEMKVALPLIKDESISDDGLVSAAELEKGVRELMDSKAGKEARDRVMAMRDGAAAAMKDDGGSSVSALAKLVQSWK